MPVEININLNEIESSQSTNREVLSEQGTSTLGTFSNLANKEMISLRKLNFQASKAVVMQAVNYSTSNIGKWTGNSHYQQVINNGMQAVDFGIMAITNPWQAAISIATGTSTTLLNNLWEQKWDKRASSQNMARLGYSSTGEVVGRKR